MKSYSPTLHYLLCIFVAGFLTLPTACKPKATDTTSTAQTEQSGLPEDLAGFTTQDIAGSKIKYVKKETGAGKIEIEGYLLDNKKTGQWIQYGPEGDISLINHYVEGKLEGVAMRMTFRNQVDLKSNYHEGQLHGPWITYKFGKKIEERNYTNGKLDGYVRLYDERTFKVKQEAQYKNGVQDGIFRYYDEEGNVTLEYEYKNGEKVSGGMK
jgi:antitoxin component YwqK of YwqJK toxin-antitoxin module